MSRHAVADEFRKILTELQQAAARGEALAMSGGMVDPKWFRGIKTLVQMAAGDLDQKGLLDLEHKAPEKAPEAAP